MISYLGRPRIESFWKLLDQVLQVKACSDEHVVCRPARDYDPKTEPPLTYPLLQFLEAGQPLQGDMITPFIEPGGETARLEAP